MAWLVCDYGGVLSLDQPDADRARLAALSGMDEGEFWSRYWHHRPAYDRADLAGPEYWAYVLGAAPSASQFATLVQADVASWSHPNLAAVAAAGRTRTRGYQLALLSNAPIEIARGIEQLLWLQAFHPRLFSCDLRSIKPEPAIYQSMVQALGVSAREVVFFDDRDDNVAGAARLGIRAQTFTAPSQFDELRPI